MTGNFDIGREGKQDIEDDRHKTRLGKNEGPKRPREQQRRSHQSSSTDLRQELREKRSFAERRSDD